MKLLYVPRKEKSISCLGGYTAGHVSKEDSEADVRQLVSLTTFFF